MEQQEEYWPTSNWRTIAPHAFDMDLEDFISLDQSAQEDERVHSILVVRSGYIVFEKYYHGWSQNKYHNVNSVTKSVTSALVGIALREKMLKSLDESIFTFFPEYTSLGEQEHRNAIRLHHLLSLTSGFLLTGEIDRFLEQTSSLEHMLSRTVIHEPGQVFSYDSVDLHLVSLILARATGMQMANFAQAYLFEPLGIWCDERGRAYPWKYGLAIEDAPHPWGLWNGQDDRLWSVDRQGNTIGAFGLQLTTREMAKLGYLYLRQGMWDGQQIIPAAYAQASLRAYSVTTRGENYGYCWYLPRWQGQNSFWAIGFGGQLLACFPDLDLVFAMTARPEGDRPPAHPKVMQNGLRPLVEKIRAKLE